MNTWPLRSTRKQQQCRNASNSLPTLRKTTIPLSTNLFLSSASDGFNNDALMEAVLPMMSVLFPTQSYELYFYIFYVIVLRELYIFYSNSFLENTKRIQARQLCTVSIPYLASLSLIKPV
jgi:hypothetical protein